jgi:hypothetical protein
VTQDDVNKAQRHYAAALAIEESKIQRDLADFNALNGFANDRAAILDAPPHVKAHFWSSNSHARAQPGDVITIYRATQTGKSFKATYTRTVINNSPAQQWRLNRHPDLDTKEARAWRQMRWPDHLADKQVDKLSHGWRLIGGFAISQTLAENHARNAAARRWIDLSDQLAEIELFLGGQNDI